MMCTLINESEFFISNTSQMDCKCKRYVWWGLSMTDYYCRKSVEIIIADSRQL